MTDLEHGHANAWQGHQIALRLLENRERQDGRTGGEVEDACHGRHEDSFGVGLFQIRTR
jgi:hypothetical protein